MSRTGRGGYTGQCVARGEVYVRDSVSHGERCVYGTVSRTGRGVCTGQCVARGEVCVRDSFSHGE
ncbi:hypothetical protein chiPu_0027544, partial [Chiloscyllium punctatum]|nr:hypothetical protein [Chiloscyllium punctatum]